MEAKNLRIGNAVKCKGNDADEWILSKIAPFDIHDCAKHPHWFSPILLTEETILNLKLNQRREFFSRPPGERQIENQWYSNEIDLTRLHLCPSYSYKMVEGERTRQGEPEFWFCWIEAYGTGSGKFLPIQPIHKNKLQFVHQLQNLFFVLTGEDLEYKPKVEPTAS